MGARNVRALLALSQWLKRCGKAPAAAGMMRLGGDEIADVQTVTRFATDGRVLFVTAEVFGVDPKGVRAVTTQPDRWPAGDDRISLLFAPSPAGGGYYFLAVTARGARFDLQVVEDAKTGKLRGRLDWNPRVRVATTRTPTGWRVELALALADLGVRSIGEDTKWRVNVRSSRGVAPVVCETWNHEPVWEPSPSSFGVLAFEAPSASQPNR